jgi:hypothetical protein
MESKFRLIEKGVKIIDIYRGKVFQNNGRWIHLFYHKRNVEILEDFKVEPNVEKLSRYKSNWLRLVTRMSNNRMPENNAELQTKWTKTTWETFEEIIRRGRNRPIKA